MEAATLFVLASTHLPRATPLGAPGRDGIQAGAVLAVLGTDDSRMQAVDPAIAALAEERTIAIALEAVRVWAERDAG
jgi:hypothetical protein